MAALAVMRDGGTRDHQRNNEALQANPDKTAAQVDAWTSSGLHWLQPPLHDMGAAFHNAWSEGALQRRTTWSQAAGRPRALPQLMRL